MWGWAVGTAIAGALLAGLIYGESYYFFLAPVVGAIVAFPIGLFIGMAVRIGSLERELNETTEFLLGRIRSLEERLQGPEARLEAAPPREAAPEHLPEPAATPETAPSTGDAPPAARVEPDEPRPEPAPQPVAQTDTGEQWGREGPGVAFGLAWRWVVDFFTGENAVVRLGLLVTFLGIAFLYGYGLEHRWIGVEWNYILASAGGLAALGWGWRLRSEREGYALLLQGGGVAVLYSAVFAATRLHGLLPPWLAFALMVAFVVLTAALALLQNSPSLAVAAAVGGYGVPLLLSEPAGGGGFGFLFGYYALLNLGSAALLLRGWRIPLFLGFAVTTLAMLWGIGSFGRGRFLLGEAFVIVYFLTFTAAAVVGALRSATGRLHVADMFLLFATPIIGFYLQLTLLRPYPLGPALSALAVAGYFAALARWLWRGRGRGVSETVLTLAIGFLTLAVPLAIDMKVSVLVWAVEGAALVWLALRYRGFLTLLSGLLLLGFVNLAFLEDLAGWIVGGWGGPLAWLGNLLLALVMGFGAWAIHAHRNSSPGWLRPLRSVFSLAALIWWLLAGARGILQHHLPLDGNHAWLLWAAASLGLAAELGRMFGWKELVYAFLGLPLLLLPTAAYGLGVLSHPFARPETWLWAPTLLLWFYELSADEGLSARLRPWGYALGFALALALVTLECSWWIGRLAPGIWPQLAFVWVPLLALLALISPAVKRHGELARLQPVGLVLVAAWVAAWWLWTTFNSAGDPRPLRYLPVLNPLELTQLLALGGLSLWWLRDGQQRSWLQRRQAAWVLGIALFAWANAAVGRAVHHLGSVAFDWSALFATQWFHTALSIFWGVTGLVLMVTGSRLARRGLWQTGLGLYGLTVVKLFLVDLSDRATVARIVSFLGVGLLLVVTGYFAPRPGVVEKEGIE